MANNCGLLESPLVLREVNVCQMSHGQIIVPLTELIQLLSRREEG